MRLFFLGTAAAEGYPGIFCNCENCNEARALGGKNLRFRSAMLINDDLLIDFGPDLMAAAQRFNRNLSQVTTGLVTHAHGDHFDTFNFHMRRDAFTGGLEIPIMRVFGPQEVTDTLEGMDGDLSQMRIETQTVHAGNRWQYAGYTFTAYHAYHAVGKLETVFYSIEDGEHSCLYATDTGPFPEETWQALEGRSFDVIILEETLGVGMYSQHQSFESFVEHAQRLRAEGILRPGGRLIAHHMSHSGNPTHEKVEAVLGPHGVEVAYDGMDIRL